MLNANKTEQEANRVKTIYQLNDSQKAISEDEETERLNVARKAVEESVVDIQGHKVSRLNKLREVRMGKNQTGAKNAPANKSRNCFNPNRTEVSINDRRSRNTLSTNATEQRKSRKENLEQIEVVEERDSISLADAIQSKLRANNQSGATFSTLQSIPKTISNPDSTKFYCGVVYRCHGNANLKYIKRIAEAYEDDFCYFKTNYSYWQTFPLIAIRYEDIACVRCIKSEAWKKLKVSKHLFEIQLKRKEEENAGVFSTDTKASLRERKNAQSKGALKKCTLNGICFSDKEQAQSYSKYTAKNRLAISRRHELSLKATKNSKDGERMMLATDTLEECEKWVGLLSWTSYFKSLNSCLLYTSDAADDMQCVDLGGRRIIKKKKKKK
eukprot:TRINITY_DN1900_c0_g1_i26.p1 TRINITY_DN1900_c0_g1~~TRINITY_DN1900_c0_g1_i26.p1  ORF type:complete len:384 (-),score=94.03 TRINITY_DN1900_c0_g1_i26:3-1154(-)